MSLTNFRTLAPAPSTVRGAPVRFSIDAAGARVLYANGSAVYIRSIDGSGAVDQCDRHTTNVTCVALSPNGNYCASGDKDGNVIVWAMTNVDKTEKIKTKPISGTINDLAWSDDSQRLAIVGDGKASYGAVILVDGGSSVGEIKGHTKVILSCDFRKQRPYRVATGGMDALVAFFEGPPFKFHHSITEHVGNVNIVRFSPDGAIVATSGADKTILLLDGKSGEKVGKITTDHTGSIYSLGFSSSGKQVITASADKTVKVFRAGDSGECVATSTFPDPSSIDYMQLGVAVAATGDRIVSISLNGDINVLSPTGGPPEAILSGHQRPVTCLAYDGTTLTSTGSDGRVIKWANGTTATVVAGLNLKNAAALAVSPTGATFVACNDDVLVRVQEGGGSPPTVLPKLSGGAVGCALLGDSATVVIATSNALFLLSGDMLSAPVKCPYGPSSIAARGTSVWVGGKDKTIHVYSADGGTLTETKVLAGRHVGAVTALAISADGTRVAAGDGNREIVVWDVGSLEPVKEYEGMVFHTTRINTVSFSPSGRYLVSGSVDTNIIVWNLQNKLARLTVNGAHSGGVTSSTFLGSENEFVTGGSDSAIRFWRIPEGW